MRDFHQPGRSTAYGRNGMCATSHPLAAKAAVQILEAGGNAVDAAIAGAVLLGFCEPAMTGIGGDCFVLLNPPGEDRVIALNGSGRSPAGFDAEAIRASGHDAIPRQSIHSVTMPGAIDAFCRLSKDWGRAGLATSLAPAIHYAEAGIAVAPRVAFDWRMNADTFKDAARDFYLEGGTPLAPGQVFRAPGQAKVLRRVAMEGRDAFYEGEVAEDIVTSLRALGGTHTLDDMAATECQYGEPVSTGYGGLDVLEHPPNGQGATALLLLNILKEFDLASMDPLGAGRAHIEAEATKLAHDARDRFIADTDHARRVDHMLAPETARKLAALIDPGKVLSVPPAGAGAVHKDTVYICVVDGDGMAVSLIYSIFSGFGSGYASQRFGILFQNRGEGFTLERGHPNEAGPGKRPLHTIIPGMLRRDGRILGPFGVMGGGYQPQGHARFVTNLADFGMDVQQAIDAPRAFADRNTLLIERGYRPEVARTLADLGHKVEVPEVPLGGAQAIVLGENGVLSGGSDPRKDGIALGY